MIDKLEFQRVEPDLLEERRIQGLYSANGACKSFWSLLSKIELAVFRRELPQIDLQTNIGEIKNE